MLKYNFRARLPALSQRRYPQLLYYVNKESPRAEMYYWLRHGTALYCVDAPAFVNKPSHSGILGVCTAEQESSCRKGRPVCVELCVLNTGFSCYRREVYFFGLSRRKYTALNNHQR